MNREVIDDPGRSIGTEETHVAASTTTPVSAAPEPAPNAKEEKKPKKEEPPIRKPNLNTQTRTISFSRGWEKGKKPPSDELLRRRCEEIVAAVRESSLLCASLSFAIQSTVRETRRHNFTDYRISFSPLFRKDLPLQELFLTGIIDHLLTDLAHRYRGSYAGLLEIPPPISEFGVLGAHFAHQENQPTVELHHETSAGHDEQGQNAGNPVNAGQQL